MFMCGPLLTAEARHGTQFAKFIPEAFQASFLAAFVRTPKTPEEARQQVDALAVQRIDAIKAVLESGVPGYPFNRLDVNVLEAVVAAAKAKNLPVSIHTGNAADVADAAKMGGNSVEHGSLMDEISDATRA